MDPAPAPKISFSLKSKAKPKPATAIPQQVSQFTALEDDEESATPRLTKNTGPVALVPAQSTITKAMKKEMERQQKVDPTVYQYDEVHDSLKEAQRLAEIKKEEESRIRQPKYIGNLLQAADQRKRDHLIAEEKMIQRERELEGDEFADKEKFVTQAYKDQLAANRKAEEEERILEELQKKQKKSGPGMTHFYASLLQQSEEKHAAVIAASKTVIGPAIPEGGASFAIRPPEPERKELSDLERARRAAEEGKHVELNEDNQIIDKRELLSAGLNLGGKNTRDLSTYRKEKQKQEEVVDVHTAVGSAASRREIDARRRREVEMQLAEEEDRRRKEKEREEEENRQRAVKRKNDDDAVLSARERYLERKRRKMEQPQQEEED